MTAALLHEGGPQENSAPAIQNSMVIVVSFKSFGTRRQVDRELVEILANKDYTNTTKVILRCEALQRVDSHDSKTQEEMRRHSLYSQVLQKGAYRVLLPSVEKRIEYLQARRAERAALVESFLSVYDECKEAMREPLGVLYDENDYPPQEVVRRQFDMRWNLVEFETPGTLRSISEELFEVERARLQELREEEIREGRLEVLRAMVSDVSTLYKTVTQRTADGKKLAVRDDAKDGMLEQADLWDELNETNDPVIREMADKWRRLANGATVDILRKDDNVRVKVGQFCQSVCSRLNDLLEEKSPRLFMEEGE